MVLKGTANRERTGKGLSFSLSGAVSQLKAEQGAKKGSVQRQLITITQRVKGGLEAERPCLSK